MRGTLFYKKVLPAISSSSHHSLTGTTRRSQLILNCKGPPAPGPVPLKRRNNKMRPDLPSKFECKSIASDTTLSARDVALNGLFVVNTPGITVTLPAAQEAIADRECFIVNNADNSVTISCPNSFPNGLDTITLAAGASVLLYCAQISGTQYRWASVGATAA